MAQRFHKFRAPTLDEAYQRMRDALGEDAVVLRTTQLKEGAFLGLVGGDNVVEITASAPVPRPRTAIERKYAATQRRRVGSDERVTETVAFFRDLVADAQKRAEYPQPEVSRTRPAAPLGPAPISPFRPREQAQGAKTAVRHELKEMREMLQVLVAETPGAGLPDAFAPHYRVLIDRGVSRTVAAELITRVVKDSDHAVIHDARVFRERLAFEIRRHVSATGGIALTPGTRRVVALVGATGVGKTTNLAKLAARFAVREGARVALITTDTYRIAAPEQLRVYANIIGIPTEVVEDTQQMTDALHTFRDHDLVLIDTAGGSQFNLKQIHELKGLLIAARPDETLLVLSANTQLSELEATVRNFRCLEPTSLFFTKLDETQRHGGILSLASEVGLPLSYLSVGQNVPDDIEVAHAGLVTNLILEGGDRRGRSSSKSA